MQHEHVYLIHDLKQDIVTNIEFVNMSWRQSEYVSENSD